MKKSNILFKLFIIILIPFTIPISIFAATTFTNNNDLQNVAINNGGTYTLTKANSPYTFLQNQIINDPNIVINIEPGVVINLGVNIFYIYNGTINYNGTSSEPVIINGDPNQITHQISSFGGSKPTANFKNVTINNCGYGILARELSTVNIDTVKFNNCASYGLYIDGSAHVNVKNITATTNNTYPNYIFIHIGVQSSISTQNTLDVLVHDTDFPQDEKHKIYIINYLGNDIIPNTNYIKFNNNTFSGNVENSLPIVIENNSQNLQIDATNNWWGTNQGPYVLGDSPTNGPQVPGNVSFMPFKNEKPLGSDVCLNIEGTQTIDRKGIDFYIRDDASCRIIEVVQPAIDICSNLPGIQEKKDLRILFYQRDNGECVIDMCLNQSGVQPKIPEGYRLADGNEATRICVKI